MEAQGTPPVALSADSAAWLSRQCEHRWIRVPTSDDYPAMTQRDVEKRSGPVDGAAGGTGVWSSPPSATGNGTDRQ